MSEELWEKEHKEWIKNMFVHPKKPDDIPDNLWTRMNEMVGSYYNALPMLVNQASPDNVGCGTGATDLSMSPVYSGSEVIPVAMFAAPGGKFQCTQCDMSFANKSAYTSHVRSHSKPPTPVNTTAGTDPYKCDVCNKTFAVPARLVRHYRTHTGERPFECEFCHKMFSVKENLQVHRRIHTKERPYKCEVCGRAFEHSGKLHRHMRIHTGERPHKCSVCGKTFIQSGQLVIHLRTHTGEKPYRCSVEGCGKGFTCSKQLKVHSRTHTGEKPYHCDICFRDFGYNHVLKLHRVQHYGSKCYKCTICEETFKNKKDMEAHIKGHANDTTEAAEDKVTAGAAVMSPETDSSCGSSTSNKENKHYAEPQDYYVYSRFEQSPLYGSGASPALLSAVEATSEESGMSSQHEVTPSSSPTSHAHLEPSMYMYEPLEVMRQHGYFAPQPMSEYTPALDKSNDIIRRVEAALAVAEAPEAAQTSPTRSTSPDSDAMELAAAAAHREMMSLPPRKRKLYLRNLEPTPVVSAVRMSSVIQFAKAS